MRTHLLGEMRCPMLHIQSVIARFKANSKCYCAGAHTGIGKKKTYLNKLFVVLC